MSDKNLSIIVLAAGKGTRMGGEHPKVLANYCCGSLLHAVLSTAGALSPEEIITVTGYKKELVETSATDWHERYGFKDIKLTFAEQEKQLGTGDAVKAALPALGNFTGEVLILCGDVPLLSSKTLTALIEKHREENATVTILSALLPDPGSYGRMIRDEEDSALLGIREAKDCSPMELRIPEINSGVYVVDSAFLSGALQQLQNDNAQQEYYLTDIVALAVKEGQFAQAIPSATAVEIQGVNTHADIQKINASLRAMVVEEHLMNGVQLIDPDTTFIHPSAKIGKNTTIGPSTVIGKEVSIGENVTIEGLCHITQSSIGDNTNLRWGLRIEGASVASDCLVGPFAHLRPGTELSDEVKIGNFVETKNASLAKGAKASHLTYLGDCNIGEESNIGAGTITCNYDGYKKYQTIIEDNVFIGSNSALIAPVTIGKGATVGAGSTITKDVAADALSVTRAEQKHIPSWSSTRRKKMTSS